MPITIIRCPSCEKPNRIDTDIIGLKVKCWSCGNLFPYDTLKQIYCRLCFQKVSDGLNLSDGTMIHTSCLDSLQKEKEIIEDKLNTTEYQVFCYESELRYRERISFKFLSIFKKPNLESADIDRNILDLRNEISNLSNTLSSVQSKLTLVYDHFLTYPPDWENRKDEIIDRDGKLCSKCGRYRYLHLHHINPLSRGGTNQISNLILLCEKCHSKRHGGRRFKDVYTESETAFSKRISRIRFAIQQGNRVEFKYRKPNERHFHKRTIIPIELVNIPHRMNNGSTLCVSGFCELRQANRNFALKRMKNLKIVD